MAPMESSDPAVQVLDKLVNSDLTADRNEFLFRTPVLGSFVASLLKERRDEPMVCLMLNITEYLLIGVSFVYGVNIFYPTLPLLLRNLAGLLYMVALLALFMERFILMLHFASHRPIFHSTVLNCVPGWILAPFFGIPSGVYKFHHVVMHHIENNHLLDISSTEKYQRDSLWCFAQYWFRFAFFIGGELPYYAYKTKRWDWFKQTVFGILMYFGCLAFLALRVSSLATLWVFIIPHFVAMTAMSFGNWSQHIFVNPQEPDSNYALTYNCIDVDTNQRTFNDGYHVIHHLNARLHWTELPEYFHNNKSKHLDKGALTFRGLHFFDVGMLVMTGRLRKLAEHYVHLGPEDTAPTTSAIEERLRSWLVPVPTAPEVVKSATPEATKKVD